MKLRWNEVVFVVGWMLLFAHMTKDVMAQGAIVPISASKLKGQRPGIVPVSANAPTTQPATLGPELPSDSASALGTMFPISGPSTRTDDELLEEFLKHTHPHVHHDYDELHRDYEKRLTRLELRINEVIEIVNKLMPMALGAQQRTLETDSKFQGIQSRVQVALQKVTEFESKFQPLRMRFDREEKKVTCLRAHLDWLLTYVNSRHGDGSVEIGKRFEECEGVYEP
jgi:hypothetical protein